jgi:ribonucleoside-diphosphate reductase alpha subunit
LLRGNYSSIFKMSFSMKVTKRNGSFEPISFDKVLGRIRKASKNLQVNPDSLTQQVLARIYDGVKTSEIDELTGQLAASLSTTHPDYGILASRIAISNHQKNTDPSFTNVMIALHNQINPKTNEQVSYVNDEITNIVKEHGKEIDAKIDHDRDYVFDYFGFKTLEKSYLLRDSNRKILERPQHLWMRVSLAIWPHDLKKAFETYDYMSQKYFTHATPTLFNAGTMRQQLSSCFLLSMADDSIAGIYKTLGDCAMISKHAGGIGLHLHNVRARGSLIKGTNGTSNGIVPMLRVFNNTARYVDQCFTPETSVYTQNGIKRIEDINTTDKVLTSTGNYEVVNMPVRHEYNGEMLKIQVKNAISSIQVTPEHQVFALKGQAKGLNFDVIRNRLNKKIVKPEFEDARDLAVGDFVVYPIPNYVNDIESMSEDDCRLYGIMLGDGHISEAIAYVSLHSENKKETAEFVLNYFEKRGIKTIVEQREDLNTRVRWSSNAIGFKFTRSQMYDLNKEKHIDISMLHLPNNKLIQIIRGLIETDGCVGTKEVSIEMSSDNVIEGLRYMLLRIGCLASGYERDRVGNVSSYKNITTRKTTKVLRIPRVEEIMKYFPDSPPSEYVSYLKHDNYIYSRIESIEQTTYNGVVHDFEIAEPHDYTVAHLGIAHNGGGKRNGSFAMYLEPWHADVEDFLRMKQNTGAEEERARDLFYALWIPDLFMKRIDENGMWSLFCPNEAPGLADVVGAEFEALYTKYESEKRYRKQISARKLWFEILDAQIESGTPYLLYKDAANLKSNQQNVGVIKSSNLCTEIIEYSDANETAVCNLASIGLPTFIKKGAFDFNLLRKVVHTVTTNLNRVIDINYYPTPETHRSNMRHRPIGLGVQGLADVFAILKLSWESEEAKELNRKIFEHIYFAALESSMELAKKEGSYETFTGSPASKGVLQFDMWNVKPSIDLDWDKLKKQIVKHGLRNSLLVAPMPTASTSQILGFNECFEPFTTNIYTRRTLAGEFVVINKYLLKELIDLGIWNEDLKQKIVAHNGSIQNIEDISDSIKPRYKTSWELSQKVLIDMAADRGAYICQSQSLNLFMADPDYAKLTSMHFYAWRKGLKTGCYYLRTKAPVAAQKFTVDPRMLVETAEDKKKRERKELLDRLASEYEEEQKKAKEAVDSGEGCLSCSG